jgi:hypothetical protein
MAFMRWHCGHQHMAGVARIIMISTYSLQIPELRRDLKENTFLK